MNTFHSLSIYFFPIFPHGEKWENTHFSMGKNGVGPPPPPPVIDENVRKMAKNGDLKMRIYGSKNISSCGA